MSYPSMEKSFFNTALVNVLPGPEKKTQKVQIGSTLVQSSKLAHSGLVRRVPVVWVAWCVSFFSWLPFPRFQKLPVNSIKLALAKSISSSSSGQLTEKEKGKPCRDRASQASWALLLPNRVAGKYVNGKFNLNRDPPSKQFNWKSLQFTHHEAAVGSDGRIAASLRLPENSCVKPQTKLPHRPTTGH